MYSHFGDTTLAFRNRQRTRVLNLAFLRRILRTLLAELRLPDGFQLCVHFIDPEAMARLNEKYLGHSGSTDVITFDLSVTGENQESPNSRQPGTASCPPIFGEIFISVGDALNQAREFGTSWQSEVVRYLIHGVLHLCGYSDLDPVQRRIMKREENRLLRQIQRRFKLKELNSGRASKWTNAPSASSFEPVR